MLTWLDYYVAGARDQFREAGLPASAIPPTDRAAMEALCLAELAQLAHQPPAPDELPPLRALLQAAVLPFVAPRPEALQASLPPGHAAAWTTPRGIQLTRELVADLAEATPPATDASWPALRRHTWYLDLPHQSLMSGEQQVRAIFVQPSARMETVMLLAILTPPGSDQLAARVAWLADAQGEPVGAVLSEGTPALDDEAVRRQVTAFVILVMLYRQTARDQALELLPYVPAEHLAGLSDKKQRARAKTHSVFRILRLRPPADRFGRPAGERADGSGWRLQHRVRVRGHFRWQPYGPRASLRRLQWIAAHARGPADAPEQVDLERH